MTRTSLLSFHLVTEMSPWEVKTISPSWSFSPISCDKFCFRSGCRVPVIYAFFLDTYCMSYTGLYQLSVNKWCPLSNYGSMRCKAIGSVCPSDLVSMNFVPEYIWTFKTRPSFVHSSKTLSQDLRLLFLMYCWNTNWLFQSIIDSSIDNSLWGVYISSILWLRWLMRNLTFAKQSSGCWDSLPNRGTFLGT